MSLWHSGQMLTNWESFTQSLNGKLMHCPTKKLRSKIDLAHTLSVHLADPAERENAVTVRMHTWTNNKHNGSHTTKLNYLKWLR